MGDEPGLGAGVGGDGEDAGLGISFVNDQVAQGGDFIAAKVGKAGGMAHDVGGREGIGVDKSEMSDSGHG